MSRLLPLAISMVLLIALLLNVSCGSVSRSTATATVTSTITTTQTPPATTTTQTLTTTTATTTTAHTLTLDPSLDLTFIDVTYIIITPGTVTIAAGSQLYTVTAYDYEGYSFDVTRDCDFNVSRGASGSWFFNEYISENTGTWKVTGNYWNPTDGTEFWRTEATLIVKE